MPLGVGEQPVQHRAKRGNTSSCRDEDGVAQGRMQNEIAERALEPDLRSFRETAKMVRHEAILHAVQAERYVSVLWWRGDRVGACDLLALRGIRLHGNPLSGDKTETSYAADFELEVLGEIGERERVE